MAFPCCSTWPVPGPTKVGAYDCPVIEVALNPAVEPVAFLLGRWRGEGTGQYPTIKSFRYREEVFFGHNGKAFLTYMQSTWSEVEARPLHGEMGFLRIVDGKRVEFVIAQGIGISEIDLGRVEGKQITVESNSISGTPTAKPVTSVRRKIWLDGDVLRYELEMAFGDVLLTNHLRGSLRRA